MAEENFDERRSTPRISVVCPILMKGSSREHHGLLRNISVGGAAVEIAEQLAEKVRYTVEFILPNGPGFKATVEIMWTIPREKIFLYGLKFVSLGFFGEHKLKSYMGKHLPKGTI